MANAATSRPPARSDDLLRCLLCIALVWTILLVAPHLASTFGAGEHGGLVAFVAAMLAVATFAPRGRARPLAPALGTLAAGFVSGVLSFAGWAVLVSALGAWLGLAPPSFAPGAGTGLEVVVTAGVLGPVFEEWLYRGWLLPALAARWGGWLAVPVSSAVFAVSHGDAWSMLTTFGLGLVLGVSRRLGVRTSSCVGAHAGLNVAFLFRESLRLASAPAWLPLLGLALWALCVRLDRGGPHRRPPVPTRTDGC